MRVVRTEDDIDQELGPLNSEQQQSLQVTCAGCHERVLPNAAETIEGHAPVVFHACQPMRAEIDSWLQAIATKPKTPAPATTE